MSLNLVCIFTVIVTNPYIYLFIQIQYLPIYYKPKYLIHWNSIHSLTYLNFIMSIINSK